MPEGFGCFLIVNKIFRHGSKNKISKCRFVKNVDFTCLHKKMEANNATKIEYFLSSDMAKMLSMMENNAKGDEARRYFLECEKQLNIPVAVLSPAEILVQQAQQFLKHEQELSRLSDKIAVIEAKQADIEEDYFSVKGYCSLMGERIDTIEASKIGRKCATLSRQEGIKICKISDQRYGQINSYHKDILERIILTC